MALRILTAAPFFFSAMKGQLMKAQLALACAVNATAARENATASREKI